MEISDARNQFWRSRFCFKFTEGLRQAVSAGGVDLHKKFIRMFLELLGVHIRCCCPRNVYKKEGWFNARFVVISTEA